MSTTKQAGLIAVMFFVVAADAEIAKPEPNASAAADDWPQFMGPARTGVVANSPHLLDAWPKGRNEYLPT